MTVSTTPSSIFCQSDLLTTLFLDLPRSCPPSLPNSGYSRTSAIEEQIQNVINDLTVEYTNEMIKMTIFFNTLTTLMTQVTTFYLDTIVEYINDIDDTSYNNLSGHYHYGWQCQLHYHLLAKIDSLSTLLLDLPKSFPLLAGYKGSMAFVTVSFV